MQLPAIVEGMDFATYLADPMPEPSLTSSLVKDLLGTAPRKVWENTPRLNRNAENEERDVFDLGAAAHRLFTGSGAPIVEIDADDFRSKAAKEQREEARAAGKTPILRKNMPRVTAMARAALDQVRDNPDIGKLFAPANAMKLKREASIFWAEAGVTCRARPDFYSPEENVVIHYKTTGTDIAPATLAKFAASQGWDMTAAHYHQAAKMLTGSAPRQYFVVQETAEPHLLLTAEIDNTFLETALMRRERALTIWARCLRENVWPGMISRTIRLECPEWHERNLIAEKDAENAAKAEGTDLLEMMRHWQAPEGWQPAAVQGARRDEVDMIE
jgi:hypothetical protein